MMTCVQVENGFLIRFCQVCERRSISQRVLAKVHMTLGREAKLIFSYIIKNISWKNEMGIIFDLLELMCGGKSFLIECVGLYDCLGIS